MTSEKFGTPQTKLPLSVFIIAKDEADRIVATINSVKHWVDEVIVVDSGSTDATVAVSTAAGARVIYNAWPGYGAQKRFAEEQCRQPWVLNLDADECVSPQLAQEIIDLFSNDHSPLIKGYRLPIIAVYPHETKPGRWGRIYYPVRLYHLDYGRYRDHAVHDRVVIDEKYVSTLTAPVLHYSFRNLSHLIEKMNSYTDKQVDSLKKPNLWALRLRLLGEFPISFFKSYILHKRIFTGMYGFILSVVYAFQRFIRVAKFYEQHLNKKR